MRCLHIINIADLIRLNLNERKRGIDFSLSAEALSSILKAVEYDDVLAFVFDCDLDSEQANLKYFSANYSSGPGCIEEMPGINLASLETAFIELQTVLYDCMADCSLYFISLDLFKCHNEESEFKVKYSKLASESVTAGRGAPMTMPALSIAEGVTPQVSRMRPIACLPELKIKVTRFYATRSADFAVVRHLEMLGLNKQATELVNLQLPGSPRWDLAMKNKHVAQIVCGVDDVLLCYPWIIYQEEKGRRFCNQFYRKIQAKVFFPISETWHNDTAAERFKQLKNVLYRLFFEHQTIDFAFMSSCLVELNTLNSPHQHLTQLKRWFDGEFLPMLPEEIETDRHIAKIQLAFDRDLQTRKAVEIESLLLAYTFKLFGASDAHRPLLVRLVNSLGAVTSHLTVSKPGQAQLMIQLARKLNCGLPVSFIATEPSHADLLKQAVGLAQTYEGLDDLYPEDVACPPRQALLDSIDGSVWLDGRYGCDAGVKGLAKHPGSKAIYHTARLIVSKPFSLLSPTLKELWLLDANERELDPYVLSRCTALLKDNGYDLLWKGQRLFYGGELVCVSEQRKPGILPKRPVDMCDCCEPKVIVQHVIKIYESQFSAADFNEANFKRCYELAWQEASRNRRAMCGLAPQSDQYAIAQSDQFSALRGLSVVTSSMRSQPGAEDVLPEGSAPARVAMRNGKPILLVD